MLLFFEIQFEWMTRGYPFKLYKERSYSSVRASYFSVRVINVWNSLPADRVTFLLLLPSNRQLNRLILVSFYWVMTIEFVLAELLGCDSERVFCNSLYFMFLYFILYCGQLLVPGIRPCCSAILSE